MAERPAVAVAGVGPVGMVAALALAEGGVPLVVFEKGPELPTESRASTFHPPTLEILDQLGVADELLGTGLQAPVFQQRDRRDGVLADLDLTILAGETAFPFRLQSEQVNLTRIVMRRLAAMAHVDIRFSSPVERVETGHDHVLVHLEGRSKPERFAWLVAAEGTRSPSRSSLGIAFEGMTYPERFLVVSSEHDWRETFPDLAYVSYIADPSEWMVLLRTPRHWRALFPVPAEETDEEALAPDRVQQRLQGVSPRPEPYPVIHTTIYNVHQRVAATFRRGRVLLAGDAAHINNPLGGMGMNSGIHDAWAAARAVQAALDGADPDACAASYAEIRRSAALDYVQIETHGNFTALSETDDEARRRRASDLARLVGDPDALQAHLRRTSMLASARRTSAQLEAALAGRARPTPSSKLCRALAAGPVVAAATARSVAAGGQPCVYLGDDSDGHRQLAVVDAGRRWSADPTAAVRAAEQAGAAAVILSDIVARGDGAGAWVVPEENVAAWLATALRSRTSVLVVARSTAGNPREARRRCRLFAQWGADLVMADAVRDGDALALLRRDVPAVKVAAWSRSGVAGGPGGGLAGADLLIDAGGGAGPVEADAKQREADSKQREVAQ